MTRTAIKVEGISKEYVLGGEVHQQRTFREMIMGALKEPVKRLKRLQGRSRQQEQFWALKDISFTVEEGEVVGIIGANGAGKSTLLKILSRITAPTEGSIEYRGRIASLLEVGTGFHPELSGRENIFINGAILGMSRSEIRNKFDEIVDFAGIEQFLDTPVKRYSSGMYVRLAFAVAAHLDPDILIVDEVLAVGDISFQKKCLGKMKDVAGEGRTVLFVSHNMSMIQSLCTTAVLLEEGELRVKGETGRVIDDYLRCLPGNQKDKGGWKGKRPGNGWVKAKDIKLRVNGQDVNVIQAGQDVEFIIFYQLRRDLKEVGFRIEIATTAGESIYWFSTDFSDSGVPSPPAEGSIVCRLPHFGLMPGSYTVTLVCGTAGQLSDKVSNAMLFDVVGGNYFGTGKLPPPGTVRVLAPQEWIEIVK